MGRPLQSQCLVGKTKHIQEPPEKNIRGGHRSRTYPCRRHILSVFLSQFFGPCSPFFVALPLSISKDFLEIFELDRFVPRDVQGPVETSFFYLILTPPQPAISNHGLETAVYKPLEDERQGKKDHSCVCLSFWRLLFKYCARGNYSTIV